VTGEFVLFVFIFIFPARWRHVTPSIPLGLIRHCWRYQLNWRSGEWLETDRIGRGKFRIKLTRPAVGFD